MITLLELGNSEHTHCMSCFILVSCFMQIHFKSVGNFFVHVLLRL